MKTSRKIAIVAVFVALNVALSFVLHVPTPTGYVNLTDAGIFVAALVFGRTIGGLVGALSGMLLDLILGYPQYALWSLLAHGVEGYLVGSLRRENPVWQVIVMALGGIWMVAIYAIAEMVLSKSWVAGWPTIPANLMQAGVGLIVAVILVPLVQRATKRL